MGAEVVWIRQFTPYLSTVVYAFASILGVYLAATFAGSRVYRYWSRTHDQEGGLVWGALGFVCLLPVLTASPFFQVRFGIAAAGAWHRTVFRHSGIRDSHAGGSLVGRRSRSGWQAYAVNVVGCILGPLVAGFILLPVMSERWVLFVFALPG